QYSRQGSQVRLLDQVGRFGRHAEDALGLLVGDVSAPGEGLMVEVIEVAELARRRKILFNVGKRPLDPGFSIGMTNPMGAETEPERAGKCRHLRRDNSIGVSSGNEDDAG